MSFMALSYGTSMLFTDGEPVNFEDLVIFARAPGGPIDLLDFFVKGRDNTKRTWPPSGMISGMKSFTFDFMRKSTLQGVHVELQDGLWPSDWFELKKKKKTGTITKQEEQKQNDNRAYVLNQFPLKSFQELFGTPRPYTFVGWGTLESGEMDKLIRAQRHRSRK
ncbi:hypothetical protein L2W58_05765 [Dethiosulfovibrio sp. F2B]|uniref:hypothetical protein n=1 Tax=Dethiosulfovibrio faecalis TaxID=2720018 RepID=UPI001F3D210B|nr:hypothetical protein [Dethiosulfovibrio faecalis]MCF4151304.1 hypothetical protein [Dethiosulfovibrio faecalis]